MPIVVRMYVLKPNTKVETSVPSTANSEIVPAARDVASDCRHGVLRWREIWAAAASPKLRKNSLFFSVKPAAKTMGGSRP